jgi:hypothetical protein
MTPASTQTALVRTRRFSVRSVDEVSEILAKMKQERFQGVVKVEVREGGTPTSVEFEDRKKISPLDSV